MRINFCLAVTAAILLAGPCNASPASNKAAAINAMIDLVGKQDPASVDRYFASPYVQHNTGVPNGIEGLRDLVKMSTAWKDPNAKTYRALAEGDLVVLQSVYSNLGNHHDDAVAFDLFRFNKKGKIVEHWDALIPAATAIGEPHAELAGETRITDLGKTQANRATVKAYIGAAFLHRDRKTAERLLSPNLIEHDIPGAHMLNVAPDAPKDPEIRYVKVHKTVAEGNFVFVQGEGRINGDQVTEIYDLFRLKNGRIVEHWDVRQPLLAADKWAKGSVPF